MATPARPHRIERWALRGASCTTLVEYRALALDLLGDQLSEWRWTVDASTEPPPDASDAAVLLRAWTAYVSFRGTVPVSIVLASEPPLDPRPCAEIVDVCVNKTNAFLAQWQPDTPLAWHPVPDGTKEAALQAQKTPAAWTWSWTGAALPASNRTLFYCVIASPVAPIALVLMYRDKTDDQRCMVVVDVAVASATVAVLAGLDMPQPAVGDVAAFVVYELLPRQLALQIKGDVPSIRTVAPPSWTPGLRGHSLVRQLMGYVPDPLTDPVALVNCHAPRLFQILVPSSHAIPAALKEWYPSAALLRAAPGIRSLAWPSVDARLANLGGLVIHQPRRLASSDPVDAGEPWGPWLAETRQTLDSDWTPDAASNLWDILGTGINSALVDLGDTATDDAGWAQVSAVQAAGDTFAQRYMNSTSFLARHRPLMLTDRARQTIAVLWLDASVSPKAPQVPGHHPMLHPSLYALLQIEPQPRRQRLASAVLGVLLSLSDRFFGGRLVLPVGRSAHRPSPDFYRLVLGSAETLDDAPYVRVPRVERHHSKVRRSRSAKRTASSLGCEPSNIEFRGPHTTPHYALFGAAVPPRPTPRRRQAATA